MFSKTLFNHTFFKIFVVLIALSIAIYQAFWMSYNNPANWPKRPIYNIKITHSDWLQYDISKPSEKTILTYLLVKPELAIPFIYQLNRELYTIDVQVNPAGHPWQVILQLQVRHVDGHPLTVKSSWVGNCGKTGPVLEKGRTKNGKVIFNWGVGFFTKPDSTGFIWYPHKGNCDSKLPETPEYSSQFPIILEIYDDETLISREEVPIKIFQNGIKRSQVPF